MSRTLICDASLEDGFHVQKLTPNLVTGGWDTLVVEGYYFARFGVSLGFVIGNWTLGDASDYGLGSDLFLAGIEPLAWAAPAVYTVKLTFKGLLQEKPMILERAAGSMENEGTNINFEGALREKLRGTSAVPTVIAKYWQIGGAPPPMSEVGTNQTPPWGASDVPLNPWVGLSSYTTLAPHGWMLADRKTPGLPGNPPPGFEVTDVYQYRFAQVPGGAQ